MKAIFKDQKPVQIEVDEWWFNGRIIQRQSDTRLPSWISFEDKDGGQYIETHGSKRDAIKFCLENPCKNPDHLPHEYIGGKQ